ncbi:MAG: fibronectin type III domain-containing protein, partial [Bacteroidota bacterium]
GASISNATVSFPAPGQAGDTSPPTAPTNLTASNVTQTFVQLNWTASTDDVGVTGYDIYQNGTFTATTPNTTFSFTNLTPATSYSYYVKATDAAGNKSANSNTVNITTNAPSGQTQWNSGNNVLYSYNNIGINTATPSSSLEVNASSSTQRAFSISNGGSRNFQIMGDGTTYSREVFVNLNNFPDYVFAANYDLMPLTKLEAYIEENKHLPGIPSAKEMEEKPLGLAALNKLYLEKIEELTLHIIELNSKVEQLEKHQLAKE